jgi:UDP:flavonoid glycosyltransferase YjiC (YdhE family)
MLAELLPIVREWEPTVLVCDMVELAGPVAAAVAGVPNVTHAVAHPFPRTAIERASDAMGAVWEAHGLEPRPYAGIHEHFYLDIYPPSLALSGHPPGASVHAVRPAPVVTAEPEGEEPLVYVTFGTVFSRDLSAHRAVLDGIRDLPIRVLVTLGPGTDAAVLGEQPPNVEVAAFVPQDEVLPRAAAVISHAGSGTFLAALAAGVPQVLVPFGADQFQNADAAVAAGAAVRVDPDAFEPDIVRAALVRVLDDPAYSAATLRLREEIRTMPGHDEVVAELERRFSPC